VRVSTAFVLLSLFCCGLEWLLASALESIAGAEGWLPPRLWALFVVVFFWNIVWYWLAGIIFALAHAGRYFNRPRVVIQSIVEIALLLAIVVVTPTH